MFSLCNTDNQLLINLFGDQRISNYCLMSLKGTIDGPNVDKKGSNWSFNTGTIICVFCYGSWFDYIGVFFVNTAAKQANLIRIINVETHKMLI